MSIAENIPHFAIDPSAFIQALNSGALDDCLYSLRGDDGGAALNCRLSERLFYADRQADALECARRALSAAPDDDEVAQFCAWLFSNCGSHEEAAAAYEQLLARYPDWAAGYRHASGSCCELGDATRAIALGT